MIYETYADLAKRVRSWSKVLPEFVAVGGIGRSGSLVASIFAAERNIHLIDPDELGAYRPWKAPLRRECPAKEDGLVLLVDDTVSSGGTMAAARMASVFVMGWKCKRGIQSGTGWVVYGNIQ